MRYLKKFNESNISETWLEELKDFCETNLAYLLDQGFEFKYDINRRNFPELYFSGSAVNIELQMHNQSTFSWSQVKDYYIPFIQLISRRYELDYYRGKKTTANSVICLQQDEYVYVTLQDIIEDRIDDQDEFYSISIKPGDMLS
jgi:hypothetical protein